VVSGFEGAMGKMGVEGAEKTTACEYYDDIYSSLIASYMTVLFCNAIHGFTQLLPRHNLPHIITCHPLIKRLAMLKSNIISNIPPSQILT
jgi:hypothetical protein